MGPKPRFQPLKLREQRSLGLSLKTIAELKASYEIEKVKIFCKVLQIDLDYSWYYYAHIKCNKKVFPSRKLLSSGAKKIFYRCEKCNAKVSAVEASQNLNQADPKDEADYPLDLSSMSSSDQEHDLSKFLHKLDEAGEQVITKASEDEQKKVLLMKIKVEKIEGQNGAK
ncbi:hypothetical protein ARALYDRAFT_917789 [Arabidopsis lyrata subsp. lyrata]|uniref:Uncharacterized protein n=1 Tax=Arabidopsis lyrata subsp. lyrata TaxID=81972 RepID=D7MM62_ARALL|nr:hypothetical protein ARALYDRAFT_917789 [Arabidopsis lyrata subsp. lyrata]